MPKNVVIIGDSHIFFYAQPFMTDEEFGQKIQLMWNSKMSNAGSLSAAVMDSNIRLIWRLYKTAYTASRDYFKTMFDVYAYDLKDIDYVLFQYGTVDLHGFFLEKRHENIEECVDRLLSSILKFSKNKSWKPIVMMTLAHEAVANREQIDRWNECLRDKSANFGIEVLDPFEVIDKNFIPSDRDKHHLNKSDVEKTLNYILKKIK